MLSAALLVSAIEVGKSRSLPRSCWNGAVGSVPETSHYFGNFRNQRSSLDERIEGLYLLSRSLLSLSLSRSEVLRRTGG